jgi:hypothetical protein
VVKYFYLYLEKNICVFYTMTNQKNKRKTQKKVKGGWLWCETFPLKYIRPCKPEELTAERVREAEKLEREAIKKETDIKIKEVEAEKKALDAQKEAEITALKTGTNAPTKLWGGRRKNKSQKKKRSKKNAKK